MTREFSCDFSRTRSNPYADKLRKADEIRITIHKEDGTTEIRRYPSVEELAENACRVQLGPDHYETLMQLADRKGVSHEELLSQWIDEAIKREKIEEKAG